MRGNSHKRISRNLRVLLLAVLLPLFIAGILAEQAQAYTINGGTASERATVQSVLAKVPWATDYIDSVRSDFYIEITRYGGEAFPDHIRVGTSNATIGLARLTGHEIWHAVQLNGDAAGGPPSIGDKWLDFLRSHGYSSWDWNMFHDLGRRHPWESLAENARGLYHGGAAADTYFGPFTWPQMTDFLLGVGIVPIWHDIWLDDTELVVASQWALSNGVFEGRDDGTFRPWDPMLKRHVALVCGRMGLEYPADWVLDYGVATRGQVRDAIPGLTWTEARWSEPILRSQLARLLWRHDETLW